MIKHVHAILLAGLAAALVSACDCGDEKDKCDFEPSVQITQPGSTQLTEFHDTSAVEEGIQYPVTVRTIGVPEDTELTYDNDKRPGEEVRGSVVLEDPETLSGYVEFGNQTFEPDSNHICVKGGVYVNQMADGSTSCSVAVTEVQHCIDVTVKLGVPACRFDEPADGSTLTEDPNPSRGFQHDVEVSCKGVNDGETVALIVNGRDLAPLEGSLNNGEVSWDDVDFAQGRNILRAETTGTGGEDVAAEIGVTVDTGSCALYILPEDGSILRADADEDPDADGLQVTLTVRTDAAGKFACDDGSEVTLLVAGDEYPGTLSGGSAAVQATLRDGTVYAYATAREPAGGRTGESLTNRYFVCATPVALEITAPRDGLTITDTADRDPEPGIQVAVGGTSSGVPAAENLRLLVDGAVVTEGTDPLVPAVFFPDGAFEFQYATFSQSKGYTIQVAGADACALDCTTAVDCAQEEQCIGGTCMRVSPIHAVTVQTEQRTCLITDPLNGRVLLSEDDIDGDESNGLQYEVHVVTENVPDGSNFTLYVSGQDPLGGLMVQDNHSANQVTFTTAGVTAEEKTLQCMLDTGEASAATIVTVDGHSPTVEIVSPADQASFDRLDITVDLVTSGVEDGVEAEVLVESGADQHTYRCTVTGNSASCDITLFGQAGVVAANTITASVSDQAGNPAPQDAITVTTLVVSAPPLVTFLDPDEAQTQPVAIGEASRVYTVVVRVDNLIAGAPVDLVVVDNTHERPAITADLSSGGLATFPNVLLPRGSVQLKASATNALGSDESTVELLVGDTSLPVVTITAPPDQTHTQLNTVDVTVDSDVEAGQTCYLCARVTPSTPSLPAVCDAGSSPADQGPADSNGDVTLSVTLSEDDFELWASCENQAGDTGTSIPVRVVVDQTAPTVEFTEPQDAAVYNAQSPDRSGQAGFQIRVQLTADVEDGQGASLTVDGSPAGIVGEPPEFENGLIVFDAVTVPDDSAPQLGANVCDLAGNCTDAAPVTITVDRTAPDVVITAPADLAKLGTSADQSAAPGFQTDVTCDLADASEGDELALERKIGSGSWTQLSTHTLTASELSTYKFANATLIPDDDTSSDPQDVQLRATITDAAQNTDSDQVTVTVNRVSPEVIITRPVNDQDLNINWDMGSEAGFQTQVDVQTYHTALGDLLVLCASPGTGYPVGHCTGHGNEVWLGTVTGVTTFISNVDMDQGDNTLVAFAENIPGQGTYSAPITVHVDSVPPTVDGIVVTSDANTDGCLSSVEGGLQATVTVSGAADGRIVRLIEDWPSGLEIARAPLSGGSAALSASLSDGDHDLTAVVTDSFGNPNISVTPAILDPEATFSVTVDTLAPTLAISEPTKSTLNRSDDLNPGTEDLDFNFIVATSAENAQPVLFEIDGNPVGTSAVSGGAASLQAAAGQGNHTLRATVSDFCGNPAAPATAGIFVDTIQPTVTCSQPQDNDTFTTQQVQFICTTTGTDSTQRIRVASTEGGQRCSAAVDASDTTTFDCTLLGGVQDLSVTVTDPAGNVSDPDAITNVNVNVAGCDIAFMGLSGLVVFNASDDSDSDPSNGLQIDLTAQSGNCNGTDCPACRATLRLNDTPFGSPQPLTASGTVTFQDVSFQHNDAGIDVEVELDDGAGGTKTDIFTVELVDLYPPELVRDAPGADAVTCVCSSGNPNADGSVVLADKLDGAPCDMDFAFTVTDGGDPTYPGTLSLEEGGSPVAGPTSITSASQAVSYTNVQLAHDSTHALTAVASDYAGNTVTIPMTVEADVLAPAQLTISDAQVTHTRHADVALTWNAVGDDETTGTATAYALRWSRDPITSDADWDAAEELPCTQLPAAPGTPETHTAQWLPPLNTYHLAIRAVDEVGNHSPLPADVAVANMWNEVAHTGPGGYFGYNLWNVGDLNNDGLDDLVVSAPTLDGNAGSVYVFYGESDLSNWTNQSAPQRLTRGLASEYFGWDVCGVGDLDGDTISDLVVTGYGLDSSRGRVSIYFGQDGSRLPGTPDAEIRPPPSTTTTFGRSAEIIGDINGDGYGDLFVGAPTDSSNGRGYIFFGRPRTGANSWTDTTNYASGDDGDGVSYIPTSRADVNILGVDVDDWFGYRHGATPLGDLDSDGHDDFALVASGVNELYTFDGASVSAITGRDVDPATDSVDVISYAVATPDTFRAGFGHRAFGGVDLTGDPSGMFDLVVTDAFSHRIYLFSGVDNSPADPTVKLDPAFTKQIVWPENNNIGWDLDVGDVNMDGWMDVIVGTASSLGHRAFIFYNTGSDPFLQDTPGTTLAGIEYYGVGVALGDFDGDGLPDVAIGGLEGGTGMLYVSY